MDLLSTAKPGGDEWQEERSTDRKTHTHTVSERGESAVLQRQQTHAITYLLSLCSLLTTSLRPESSWVLGSRVMIEPLLSLSLLLCSVMIDVAISLTGLWWGVYKIAHAEFSTRLVHSRHAVKGRLKQWEPVAKWHWFLVFKVVSRFSGTFLFWMQRSQP